MNIEFKTFIDLALKERLDLDSTRKAFHLIMNGSVSDIQISSFLSILQKSGVSADHVIGAIDVMRSKMVSINAPADSMDTCGTGGDGDHFGSHYINCANHMIGTYTRFLKYR
jgi:anthranilate phosphoribosyltransferase